LKLRCSFRQLWRGALRRVIAEPALAARLAAGSRAAGARLPEWPKATEEWERAFDRLAALDPPS
jgi:hypothetical protein